MTAPTVTLDHAALDAIIDAVERSDRRRLMDRVGRAIHSDLMLRFRRGAAPDGTPWEPLLRPRKRGPGQPLRDTGRLQRSYTWRATSERVVIGTNVEYGAAHQYGVRERGLPARPMLGFADPQVELINTLVERWAQEVLNGHPG